MTIIQKIVRAGDLPPEWAKEFADPDMKINVRLTEHDDELANANTPIDIMRVISRRAEERGLTPEIVEKILNEK